MRREAVTFLCHTLPCWRQAGLSATQGFTTDSWRLGLRSVWS